MPGAPHIMSFTGIKEEEKQVRMQMASTIKSILEGLTFDERCGILEIAPLVWSLRVHSGRSREGYSSHRTPSLVTRACARTNLVPHLAVQR